MSIVAIMWFIGSILFFASKQVAMGWIFFFMGMVFLMQRRKP